MLRQGHPIDVTAGYFDEKGQISDDFWMLDKTSKLYRLAELREDEKHLQAEIKNKYKEYVEATQNRIQEEVHSQGEVSQPRKSQTGGSLGTREQPL